MIPKIIHQIWLTGDEFPFAEYRRSWQLLNPEYIHFLWTLDNIGHAGLNNEVYDIIDDSSLFFLPKVELLKFSIVYKYGGIYADTDMECLKSFDTFIDHESFVGMEDESNIGISIFGAERGNENIKNIRDHIISTIRTIKRHCNLRPVRFVGPRAPAIQKILWNFEGIYGSRYFYPFNITELDKRNGNFSEAYTKHHWNCKSETGWIKQLEEFNANLRCSNG